MNRELIPDGVHPSSAGHEALSKCLLPHLDSVLSSEKEAGNESDDQREQVSDHGELVDADPTEEERRGGGDEELVKYERGEAGPASAELEEDTPQTVADALRSSSDDDDDDSALYFWKPGPWSACSRPCGGGIQTRALQCTEASTSEEADDSRCKGKDVVAWPLQQPCNEDVPCPPVMASEAHWMPGKWTECDSAKVQRGFNPRLGK